MSVPPSRLGPRWETQVLHDGRWRLGFHLIRQVKPVTAFRGDAYRVRWWNWAILFKLGRRRVVVWHFVEETN